MISFEKFLKKSGIGFEFNLQVWQPITAYSIMIVVGINIALIIVTLIITTTITITIITAVVSWVTELHASIVTASRRASLCATLQIARAA
jgi:5-bromo-4-chloroindolyl phosphate hydrolysis protein